MKKDYGFLKKEWEVVMLRQAQHEEICRMVM